MLVDYSDSESDSGDQKPEPPPQSPPVSRKTGLSALLPKPKESQKTGQDGDIVATGPRKFIVNLPKLDTQGDDADGPPAKKIRTGGGGSGLSAMLPAPKRSGATVRVDPKPSPSPIEHGADRVSEEAVKEQDPASRTIGGTTMFVPQSVSRKPIQPASAFKKSSGTGAVKPRSQVPTKVSLFGAGTNSSTSNKSNKKTLPTGEYKPIMVSAAKPVRLWDADGNGGDPYSVGDDVLVIATDGEASYQALTDHGDAPEDLDAIARQAGLDDSAMRQLYGRRGRQDAPINISTFSVDEDQEYCARETSIVFSAQCCASAEGRIGGKLCSGKKKQKGGWLKIWMVASGVIYGSVAKKYCF
ncbi:unnamed protein product [Tuber melanosporum]|uniref:(Perigord truffle) hypothetical protein n=1 Tax=Tuber melanosporum (strain Mel28) TaxID=656061 RepID=D5G7S6_TUBMM|nr:uncharacterized protein GSTUM_00004706001 [Tuber melanosporum]CAZ80569.1 unnamed protein product [Tuber melanosporum]